MLLLDRCVFSQRFTFKSYHDIFVKAQNVKNLKDIGKEILQGERLVGREQLIFIFEEIGKTIYKIKGLGSEDEINYRDRFFNDFLSEKVHALGSEINYARVPTFDDTNKKLFSEEAIRILGEYEEELRHVFVAYMIENYFSMKKSKRLLLSEREVRLQNKKWPYTSIILYLKESETAPHLNTIEHIEDLMRQIVPHTNQKQQEFYSRHVMADCYHKEGEMLEGTCNVGDPGLYFHEFVLFIGRVAWDSYPKELDKKSLEDILKRYINYVQIIRNGEQIQNTIQIKKFTIRMKEYYKYLSQIEEQKNINNEKNDNQKSKIDVLTQRIKEQIFNAPSLNIDFAETAKALDKELPKLPPLPIVVPENPGPYKKADAITIGMQPPPEPVNKEGKGEKDTKKASSGGGKKDEIPPRVFQWEDVPALKTSVEDHLKSVEQKLSFEVQPLNSLERGSIPKKSNPVLISEVLFPGELPESVVPYLLEASNALNERNFITALESYENGLKVWKKTQVEVDSASELFFEYSKGNIYLSIGKLEYALQSFYGCKKFSDASKLNYNNPDRSLPYFGLGEVFYEMQEWALAARAFLKAREIRETILGLEHVQTATVFNNLACCFFMLGRGYEALGYIEISEVIFDTELGEHHERTMVARQNQKKITGGTFDHQPEYKRFWEVFEEDKFAGKKKAKKGGDGKGKKK